jgi:hypothetical protein
MKPPALASAIGGCGHAKFHVIFLDMQSATKKKRKPAAAKSRADRQREAVERHRSNMRKQGMRLLQLWVPDTDAPGFANECRRQSLRVSRHPTPDDRVLDRELEGWAALADKDLGKP